MQDEKAGSFQGGHFLLDVSGIVVSRRQLKSDFCTYTTRPCDRPGDLDWKLPGVLRVRGVTRTASDSGVVDGLLLGRF
jgi:hypothetical protein